MYSWLKNGYVKEISSISYYWIIEAILNLRLSQRSWFLRYILKCSNLISCNHWKVHSLGCRYVIFSGILIVMMSFSWRNTRSAKIFKVYKYATKFTNEIWVKREKSLIIGLNKGSAKGSANIQGSAEPPNPRNQRFGSAEPNIRSDPSRKFRPNRIFGRTLKLRFGRIRIFGAPLFETYFITL